MAKIDSKKTENRLGLNWIDFVVLFLVLICLAGAVVRIRKIDWFAKASDLDEYKIHFSVTDIAYTSKKAFVIGDTITLCDDQAVLGTLYRMDSVQPSTFYVKDSEGNVLSAQYPESVRIDVTGTVLSKGTRSENGYFLGGTTYLAPGRSYRVQSEHMDFTLKILEIENP